MSARFTQRYNIKGILGLLRLLLPLRLWSDRFISISLQDFSPNTLENGKKNISCKLYLFQLSQDKNGWIEMDRYSLLRQLAAAAAEIDGHMELSLGASGAVAVLLLIFLGRVKLPQ